MDASWLSLFSMQNIWKDLLSSKKGKCRLIGINRDTLLNGYIHIYILLYILLTSSDCLFLFLQCNNKTQEINRGAF